MRYGRFIPRRGGRERKGNRKNALSGPGSALQWVRSGSDLLSFMFVYFLHDSSYRFFFISKTNIQPRLLAIISIIFLFYLKQ